MRKSKNDYIKWKDLECIPKNLECIIKDFLCEYLNDKCLDGGGVEEINSTTTADDSNLGLFNTPVMGNVLDNDTDAEGNTQLVMIQNISTEDYDFTLNTDGVYIFTPKNGFSGTVNLPYIACDDGSPVVCSASTLTIEVLPGCPDLTIGINESRINPTTSTLTYNFSNVGNAITDGSKIEFRIFKTPGSGTLTITSVPAGWTVVDEGEIYRISTTSENIETGLSKRVKIVAEFVLTPGFEGNSVTLFSDIIFESGGDCSFENNADEHVMLF